MFNLTDEFVNVISNTLAVRSKEPSHDVWPYPYADITLSNELSASFLLDILYDICFNGGDVEEISKAFVFPSKLAYYLYLFSTRPSSLDDASLRMALAEKELGILSFMRNGDTFLRNSNNHIAHYEDGKIKDWICSVSDNQQKMIRKLFLALSTINELEYFAWVGLGREIHGPYVDEYEQFLVRCYHDLKPDCWNFTKNIPWRSIEIVTNAPEIYDISYDFNGRIRYSGKNEFDKAALFLNGEQIEIGDMVLKDIFNILSNVIKEATSIERKMSSGQLLLKFVETQYYVLRKVGLALHKETLKSLPLELKKQLLEEKNKSEYSGMMKKLVNIDDNDEWINIMRGIFHPGNINKFDDLP